MRKATFILALLCAPATAADEGTWVTAADGCQFWFEEFDHTMKADWEGPCPDGKADGDGVLTLEATTNEVTITATYSGAWREGRMHGPIVIVDNDGTKIEADYRDGGMDGPVVVTYADGQKFEGEVRAGHPDGYGIQTWPNGDRYEGQWRNGKPHGSGAYYHADGAQSYAGIWTNGCFRIGDRWAVIGATREACGF